MHGIVPVHDDFAMWVLANRPGFLGNNFFREIGDAFSVFVLHNPDQDSEEVEPTTRRRSPARKTVVWSSPSSRAPSQICSLHSDAGGGERRRRG